jgi:hypothetical protein
MRKHHLATILGFLLFSFASVAPAQNPPDVAKLAADASKESQACIACHESGTAPLAVQQWAASRHAQVGIQASTCGYRLSRFSGRTPTIS